MGEHELYFKILPLGTGVNPAKINNQNARSLLSFFKQDEPIFLLTNFSI